MHAIKAIWNLLRCGTRDVRYDTQTSNYRGIDLSWTVLRDRGARPDYDCILGSTRKGPFSDITPSRFPIQDLPPELLAEVFYAYILLIHDARGSIFSPKAYAWLIIRHVCRAWRAVALANPKLSSHITATNAECVQNMLRQSGAAPLYVYDVTHCHQHGHAEVQDAIYAQLDRIVWADIHLVSLPTRENSAICPRSEVSPLRTLTLQCDRVPTGDVSLLLWPEFSFPHLQTFKGTHTDLRLFSSILPSGLRRLSLLFCLHNDVIDDFVTLLRSLSQLEELSVHNFLYDDLSFEPIPRLLSQGRIATLPNLVALDVGDVLCDRGLRILQRFVYPSSTNVKQTYEAADLDHPDNVPPDIVLAKFSNEDSVPPQSLHLASDRKRAISLRFWTERLSLEDIITRGAQDNSACFSLSMKVATADILLNLVQQLPLSNIRAAYIEENGDAGPLPWRELFLRLVSVEEVCVGCVMPGGRKHAWKASSQWQLDLGSPRSLFPALRAARLRFRPCIPQKTLPQPTSDPSDLRVLAHLLHARLDSGSGVTFAEGRPVEVQLTLTHDGD